MIKSFALVSMFMLLSCGAIAADRVSTDLRPTDSVEDGSGILIVNIVFNDHGAKRPAVDMALKDERSLVQAAARFLLGSGNNVHIIALDPGTYDWKRLQIQGSGGMPGAAPGMSCEVKPGVANYVGDIVIDFDWNTKKYAVTVKDESAEEGARYRSSFPALARKFPFTTSLTSIAHSAGDFDK
jgi:hypothetical protein